MDDEARELAETAIRALRALEQKMESLAPASTAQNIDPAPSAGGRWKHEGFPATGLMVLYRMMQKGESPEAAFSAWLTYCSVMQNHREQQERQGRYEPLKRALWEHACARYWRFPPPDESSDSIKDAFDELLDCQVEYFGQGGLNAPGRQAVASNYEKPERALIVANCFHRLWRSDPEKYTASTNGLGFERAADSINATIERWQAAPEKYFSEHLTTPSVIMSFRQGKDGCFVKADTVKKSLRHPDCLWQQDKVLGLRRRKGKK